MNFRRKKMTKSSNSTEPKKKNFFSRVLTLLCCCFTAQSVKSDSHRKPSTQNGQARPSSSRDGHSQGQDSPLTCSLSAISLPAAGRSRSLNCLIRGPAIKAEVCHRAASESDLLNTTQNLEALLWPVASFVRASFHQGSTAFLSSYWAGSQCTTMALAAVALSTIKAVSTWATRELDSLLYDGDRNHGNILASLGRTVDSNLRVGIYELEGSVTTIQLGSSFVMMKGCLASWAMGEVYVRNPDAKPRESFMVRFQEGLKMALDETDGAVLTVGDFSTAVIRDPAGGVCVFDSHCRDPRGLFHPDGRAVLLMFSSLANLEASVSLRLEQWNQNSAQFEVLGFQRVTVGMTVGRGQPVRQLFNTTSLHGCQTLNTKLTKNLSTCPAEDHLAVTASLKFIHLLIFDKCRLEDEVC